ncbi:unnamed protein product, partial [Vitis vinifera]
MRQWWNLPPLALSLTFWVHVPFTSIFIILLKGLEDLFHQQCHHRGFLMTHRHLHRHRHPDLGLGTRTTSLKATTSLHSPPMNTPTTTAMGMISGGGVGHSAEDVVLHFAAAVCWKSAAFKLCCCVMEEWCCCCF